MKTNIGDIVFIKNKSLISLIIIYFTKNWSHVMGIINYNKDCIEATYPKVRQESINVYKRCKYAILTPKIPLSDEEKFLFVNFMVSKLGKKYDWRGIVSFFIKSKWQNKNWYFCSELILEAYRHIGRELIRKEIEWTTPQDLYQSTELKIIEEGML